MLNYSSEKNKKKYTFPAHDKTEEQLNMAQDDRNIYEVFRDLVKKICDQIRELRLSL